MLKHENKITVTGVVKNFKIKETEGKKSKAYISVLNEDTNNLVVVTLYDRPKFAYGSKDNKVEYNSLKGLSKEFLDAEGKSKKAFVTVIGNATESVGQNGQVYENNNVFAIMPSNSEKAKAEFSLLGFIKKMITLEDKDGNEYVKLTIASINSYDKDGKTVVRGISEKQVIVRDIALVEMLEDCSVGDYIGAKGNIVSTMDKYDDWGDKVASGTREFVVTKLGKHQEQDDIDEDDIRVYKKASKLEYGESFTISKTDDDDELD
ncbi:MAG: hypothetical protein U0L26_12985 [Cellulosilyticum sp.]|nr:hypothetical protein [Cellulosilyticum sp.]